MKLTKSKTGGRRSHQKVGAPRLSRDTTTGNTHRRHFMDPVTGTYRGKQVIDVAGIQAKKEKKQQARDEVAKIGASEETEEKTK